MKYTVLFYSVLASTAAGAAIGGCSVDPDPTDTLPGPFIINAADKKDPSKSFSLALGSPEDGQVWQRQALISGDDQAELFTLEDGYLNVATKGAFLNAGFPFPMDRSFLPKRLMFRQGDVPDQIKFIATKICDANGNKQTVLGPDTNQLARSVFVPDLKPGGNVLVGFLGEPSYVDLVVVPKSDSKEVKGHEVQVAIKIEM